MSDEHFMKIALRLAERGLGTTAPNPTVGCIIVKDSQIIGRGWTAPGGRPHAEPIAIKNAGSSTSGATAYVTLEPCCHHGQTPPCTNKIIEAGIKRVVIATRDPNPNVSGRGIEALTNNGITVIENVCKGQADDMNAGFFLTVQENRPLVTLKLATTSDDKLTMPEGQNPWFTGEAAKHYAHLLRYRHDAIMVGINTVLSDNPRLTCRLPGLEQYSPIRIIMDSQFRTPADATLVKTAIETPTWIMTSNTIPSEQFESKNLSKPIEMLRCKQKDNKIDLRSSLTILAERGITRLLVEGGAILATALLEANLVDRLIWIQAPDIKGNKDAPDISATINKHQPQFAQTEKRMCGKDILTLYTKRNSEAYNE